MTTETYRILFDAKGHSAPNRYRYYSDHYWRIEEGEDGLLYVSSDTETRRVVEPSWYLGRARGDLRAGLEDAVVPEYLIVRFLEQAGNWTEG